MSEYQYTHNRAPVRRGDTLRGFAVTILTPQDTPLQVVHICCQIRWAHSRLIHTYKTEYDQLTGRLSIPCVIADWNPGVYGYDIEYTLDSGLVRKFIAGSVTVLDSNSRC